MNFTKRLSLGRAFRQHEHLPVAGVRQEFHRHEDHVSRRIEAEKIAQKPMREKPRSLNSLSKDVSRLWRPSRTSIPPSSAIQGSKKPNSPGPWPGLKSLRSVSRPEASKRVESCSCRRKHKSGRLIDPQRMRSPGFLLQGQVEDEPNFKARRMRKLLIHDLEEVRSFGNQGAAGFLGRERRAKRQKNTNRGNGRLEIYRSFPSAHHADNVRRGVLKVKETELRFSRPKNPSAASAHAEGRAHKMTENLYLFLYSTRTDPGRASMWSLRALSSAPRRTRLSAAS